VDRFEVMKELIQLASYYGKNLSEVQLNLYADDLEHLEKHVLVKAALEYRRNPENKFFPLPAEILKLAGNEYSQSPREKADVVANRIWDAIARFGWNNPDKARAYIGELGWKTVEMAGGWVGMCETSDIENKNIIIAQTRDLAMAAQSSYNVDRNKELPEASKDGVFRISNMIDTIKKNLLN
jgi:hypothetical protein